MLVIGIIPFAVQATDVAYCTYKTIDCNKLQVGTGTTAKVYNCDLGECIGIVTKGSSEVISCIEPAASKNAYADVFINSYSPICALTTCANGKTDGNTYCNGNQVLQCSIDQLTCTEKSPSPLVKTCSSPTTCSQLTTAKADCVCPTNQCNADICIGGNSVQKCLTDANGCKYLDTSATGTTNCALSGKVCKTDTYVGSCQCDNQCNPTDLKSCASGTSYYSCDANQYGCYLRTEKNCDKAFGTTLKGCSGAGVCSCPTSTETTNQKCFGSSQYRIYSIKAGDNCPTWGTPIDCNAAGKPIEKVCDMLTGFCGCPPTTSGVKINDIQCAGTYTYKIYQVPYGYECPKWSDPISCPSAYGTELQKCESNQCKCPSLDGKQPGYTKRCVTTEAGTGYQIFDYYSNNCPEWGPTMACSSTEICDETTKSCKCVASQFSIGDKKCDGDFTYKIFDRVGNDCPDWSTNAYTCPNGNMCVEPTAGKAQCVTPYQDIVIMTKDAYAINNPINLTVKVTKTFGNIKDVPVTARLKENGLEITGSREQGFTKTDGTLDITFDYIPQRSGTLTVEVTVGEGITLKVVEKEIKVLGALIIKLNCPVSGFINRDVVCTWKVEDSYSHNLLDANPQVNIMQGGSQIFDYTSQGKTGVTFRTMKVGLVNVEITVGKEGYISDSADLSVDIQDLTRKVDFKIDNNLLSSYSNGITTGTHKLALEITESEVFIDIQSIEAKITTPSGQYVPIYFSKDNKGVYASNDYNFEQAQQTYDLSGKINFIDVNTPSLPFQYKITTLASSSKDLTTYFIIGGAVAFVLLVIILIAVLSKRRSKGRK